MIHLGIVWVGNILGLHIPLRHSRVGGNPCGVRYNKLTMDSRLRGNDGDGFAELALLLTLTLTHKKVGTTIILLPETGIRNP